MIAAGFSMVGIAQGLRLLLLIYAKVWLVAHYSGSGCAFASISFALPLRSMARSNCAAKSFPLIDATAIAESVLEWQRLDCAANSGCQRQPRDLQ